MKQDDVISISIGEETIKGIVTDLQEYKIVIRIDNPITCFGENEMREEYRHTHSFARKTENGSFVATTLGVGSALSLLFDTFLEATELCDDPIAITYIISNCFKRKNVEAVFYEFNPYKYQRIIKDFDLVYQLQTYIDNKLQTYGT